MVDPTLQRPKPSKGAQDPTAEPGRATPGSEHRYLGRTLQEVECSIFDNATYFTAIRLLAPGKRERHEFPSMADAVTFTSHQSERYALYAVTESGRSMVLDRCAWSAWVAREQSSSGNDDG